MLGESMGDISVNLPTFWVVRAKAPGGAAYGVVRDLASLVSGLLANGSIWWQRSADWGYLCFHVKTICIRGAVPSSTVLYVWVGGDALCFLFLSLCLSSPIAGWRCFVCDPLFGCGVPVGAIKLFGLLFSRENRLNMVPDEILARVQQCLGLNIKEGGIKRLALRAVVHMLT